MAFGKKQARIEQLEAEASIRDKEMTELTPFIGIAKEIQASVGKIALETGNFDKAFSQTIADVSRERQLQSAEHIVQSLPRERLLEVLHSVFGDAELKEALEELRQQEILKTQDNTLSTAELKKKAKNSRIINLGEIAAGKEVSLDFCNSDLTPYWRKTKPNTYTARKITGLVQKDGILHVLSDARTFEAHGPDVLQDHELVAFGSMISDGDSQCYTPDMYVDTAVVMQHAGQVKSLNLDLLQVTVDNQWLIER